MDDLEDVWRDDQLIERLARGEVPDDPAVAPLIALHRLADAPAPAHDLDPAGLVDDGRNRRYAVRSLAVAVTAVVTLSTSGVAAVVTGDPLRPAKAVWQEITGRSGEVAQVESGQAMGAALPSDAVDPVDADANAAGDLPPRQPWEIRPSPASTPSASLAADQDPAVLPGPATTQPSDDGAFSPSGSASASPSPTQEQQDETGSTARGDDEQQPDEATPSTEDGQQDDGQQPGQREDDREPDGQAPDDPDGSPTPDDEPPDGDDVEPPLLRTPVPQEMQSTPEPTLEPALEPTEAGAGGAALPETDLAEPAEQDETAEAGETAQTPDGTDGTAEEPVDGAVASLTVAP